MSKTDTDKMSDIISDTNDIGSNPEKGNGMSTSTVIQKVPLKNARKILHRSQRGVQTEPFTKSKMLQCFVRQPSVDCRPVQFTDFSSQVSESNVLKLPKFEPDYHPHLHSFSKELFQSIGSFDTDITTSRLVKQTYKYGISFGPIFPTDFDQITFREEILGKADSHNVNFFKQNADVDVGIVDLLFLNADKFTNMICKLRKTKFGCRHLVMTAIQGGNSDRKEKATIVFDQEFSSTAFFSYMRAAHWNKPKVEENLFIHNMPKGISAEFLKRLMPDAVQWTEASETSHCHRPAVIGLCRHAGGDLIRQLFSQMYFNHQPVCFEVKQVSDVAEETHIDQTMLIDDDIVFIESDSSKEIFGKSRDILATEIELSESDRMEVVLHVDKEINVDKILSINANKQSGPIMPWKLNQILKKQSETLAGISACSKTGFTKLDTAEICDEDESAQLKSVVNLHVYAKSLDKLLHGEENPENVKVQRNTTDKSSQEREKIMNFVNGIDVWWNKSYTFDEYHLEATRTLVVEIDEVDGSFGSSHCIREILIKKLRECGKVLRTHKNETQRSKKKIENTPRTIKAYNIIMEYDAIASIFVACKAIMFSKEIKPAIKECLNFRFLKSKPTPCIWIGNLPLAEERKKEVIEDLDSRLTQLEVDVSQVFVDCFSHKALIFCSDVVKNPTMKLLKENHNFIMIKLEIDFASQACVSQFILDMLSNGQLTSDDIRGELWGYNMSTINVSKKQAEPHHQEIEPVPVNENAIKPVQSYPLESFNATENVCFDPTPVDSRYAPDMPRRLNSWQKAELKNSQISSGRPQEELFQESSDFINDRLNQGDHVTQDSLRNAIYERLDNFLQVGRKTIYQDDGTIHNKTSYDGCYENEQVNQATLRNCATYYGRPSKDECMIQEKSGSSQLHQVTHITQDRQSDCQMSNDNQNAQINMPMKHHNIDLRNSNMKRNEMFARNGEKLSPTNHEYAYQLDNDNEKLYKDQHLKKKFRSEETHVYNKLDDSIRGGYWGTDDKICIGDSCRSDNSRKDYGNNYENEDDNDHIYQYRATVEKRSSGDRNHCDRMKHEFRTAKLDKNNSSSKRNRYSDEDYNDKDVDIDRNRCGEQFNSKRHKNADSGYRTMYVEKSRDDARCRYGKWGDNEDSDETEKKDSNRKMHGNSSSGESSKTKESEIEKIKFVSLVKDKLIEKLLSKVHSDNAQMNVNSSFNVEPEHTVVMDALHRKPTLKKTHSSTKKH